MVAEANPNPNSKASGEIRRQKKEGARAGRRPEARERQVLQKAEGQRAQSLGGQWVQKFQPGPSGAFLVALGKATPLNHSNAELDGTTTADHSLSHGSSLIHYFVRNIQIYSNIMAKPIDRCY